ncbi:MAG: homospermidine synthase [Cellvibrio sp. 79]|nr:MAG: homospermidine synthase [Cellvibrio sp. 79]
MTDTKYIEFHGTLLILGLGSIGRAVIPLLLRHIEISPQQIKIVAPQQDKEDICSRYAVQFIEKELTQDNSQNFLDQHLKKDDFLLNLSIDISSLTLVDYCWRNDIFYLDTCIEPWSGHYDNTSASPAKRSNYRLREDLLSFRKDKHGGRTAVVTHGANPGLASTLVKQALENMALDHAPEFKTPTCADDWARLARDLGIKVIHIAERDTQTTNARKKRNEFVNTWSVEGFIAEGLQPAELGWGTHEKHWPADAERHGYGCDAAIFLNRPGIATRVRSWTPLEGSYHGFLITHSESISIADHLTLREGSDVIYRPTVHYAYHPCDDAILSLHELAGKNWQPQKHQRILCDEITLGMDELGVLLMGNNKGAYWFGSRLGIRQARELAPYNTATSLQVVAGIFSSVIWALSNPERGIVEPDDLDHHTILKIATPYLGEMVGIYSNWTPLTNRSNLFSEPIANDDPWQFINFRVH